MPALKGNNPSKTYSFNWKVGTVQMIYCMLLTDVYESVAMFVIGQFDLVFLKRVHCIYKHRKRTLIGRFLLLPSKTRMFKILFVY